jgi:nucleoside-diphosphate-sugar epimerase
MRVLIAGCGDVGTAVGTELAAAGHEVWGIRRSPAAPPPGLRLLRGDLTQPATLRAVPVGLDVVVYAAGPDAPTDAAYRAAYVDGLRGLLQAVEQSGTMPRRIVFLSSTGVYGQTDGSWVDEASPTEPTDFRGRRLLEAERLLAAATLPATIVRLAGIYGPGRTRLLDRLRRGEATCAAAPRYANRIHRDDGAGAIRHVVELATAAPLYLAVDDGPADECEVLRWLACQLGLPPPRVAPASGPGRRSNKRCRNARLVASGYRFRYPTYRDGYAALLREPPGPPTGGAAARPQGAGRPERIVER